MNSKTMDKIIKHFDTYFEQNDSLVIHPLFDIGYHIDILKYKPNEKFPFWKLVTMGASDYEMPPTANSCSRYNEYIMFVHADENLDDLDTLNWYCDHLRTVASFAHDNHCHISFGHSFQWKNDDPDDEMIAAFIDFPQIIGTVDVVLCKTDLMKTVACLQVVLLNKDELARLMEIGPLPFSEYLYPENGGKQHFLCERHRSDRF